MPLTISEPYELPPQLFSRYLEWYITLDNKTRKTRVNGIDVLEFAIKLAETTLSSVSQTVVQHWIDNFMIDTLYKWVRGFDEFTAYVCGHKPIKCKRVVKWRGKLSTTKSVSEGRSFIDEVSIDSLPRRTGDATCPTL